MLFSSSPNIYAGPIFDKFSRGLDREQILHVKIDRGKSGFKSESSVDDLHSSPYSDIKFVVTL